jgi:hypothetical protein
MDIPTHLWSTLPPSSRELISDLDAAVPPAHVLGPVTEDGMKQLIFLAGRRDLVEQLKRLRDKEQRNGST